MLDFGEVVIRYGRMILGANCIYDGLPGLLEIGFGSLDLFGEVVGAVKIDKDSGEKDRFNC
jgi:hypothetical protein